MRKLYLVILMAFMLVGCVQQQTRLTLNNDESKSAGFTNKKGDILENPPKDKSRIYIIREEAFTGSILNFSVAIEFNPILDANGNPNARNYQDVLCFMKNGMSCYVDIKPNIPINISAASESATYIYFTPQAGETYCIKGSYVMGAWVGRPELKLIDKKSCEKLYKSVKDDWDKSQKYLRKWRKKYIKNEKQPKLPAKLIYRSFYE